MFTRPLLVKKIIIYFFIIINYIQIYFFFLFTLTYFSLYSFLYSFLNLLVTSPEADPLQRGNIDAQDIALERGLYPDWRVTTP